MPDRKSTLLFGSWLITVLAALALGFTLGDAADGGGQSRVIHEVDAYATVVIVYETAPTWTPQPTSTPFPTPNGSYHPRRIPNGN